MADHGLIIKNVNTEIQIDSTYKNYVKHHAGYGHVDGGYHRELSFSSAIEADKSVVVAVKAPSFGYIQHAGFIKDSQYDKMTFDVGASSGGGDIYYIAFIEGFVASISGYGLFVRNNNNSIVFSSNERYFKIIGVHSGSLSHGNPPYYNSVNITVEDAANNYFILFPCASGFVRYPPAYIAYFYTSAVWRGFKYIDATTIKIGCFSVMAGGVGPGIGGEWDDSAWTDAFTLIEVASV